MDKLKLDDKEVEHKPYNNFFDGFKAVKFAHEPHTRLVFDVDLDSQQSNS